MSKRVILRCEGSLEQGFQVTLEISDRVTSLFTEAMGGLPPAIAMAQTLAQWQQHYRQSLGSARIALEQATVQTSILVERSACRQTAQDLGNQLQTWLASPLFQPIEQRLRETLTLQEPVEVLLRSRDARLHRLPWHLWSFIERYTQAELGISSLPEGWQLSPRTQAKVRILAILGDCQGIDTVADRQLLENLPDAQVVFLVEPSQPVVYKYLWEHPWDILFFAGHSQTHGQQGRIHLNPTESLTLEDIRYGLRRAIRQGLQLAIFNSCDGLGLAEALAPLHLPQLIVMREPVPDRIAQEFLKHFLQTFAQGKPLQVALRQAREWLQGLEGEFPCASWLPVLVQNPAMVPLTWSHLTAPVNQSIPSRSAGAVHREPADREGSSHLGRVAPDPRRGLKFPAVLAMSLVVMGCITGLRMVGWLEPAELWAYDRLLQLQPPAALDPRLLLVVAQDEDVKQLGDPLPDHALDRVLHKIEQYQPRVIGLDIFRDTPTGTGWSALIQHLQQSDRIVSACVTGEVAGVIDPLLAVNPPPGLSPQKLGYVDAIVNDPDDVVRRYVFHMEKRTGSPCKTPSSLGLQVIQRYLSLQLVNQPHQGMQLIAASRSFSIPALSPTLSGYQRQAAEMAGHQILIRYRQSIIQSISMGKLLAANDADLRELIHNRIVLVGYAAGDSDRPFTPLGKLYGVAIHAQVISQILDGLVGFATPKAAASRSLITALPDWAEVMMIGIWSLLGSWMAWRWRSGWLWVVLLTVTLAMIGLSIISFQGLLWLPIVAFSGSLYLAVLMIYLIKLGLRFNRSSIN
jgi:CHASE2 domain-containing sensor protein